MPGLDVLARYERAWIRDDIVAGIVLTALLIPAGIGYAQVSGLPPVTGLYATIVPLAVYALAGPSRILVLGPDSSLAPIIGASVLPLAAGDPDRAVALAGLLAILMGGFLLIGSVFRLGFVTDLLSKPIRIGYLNGVALVVIVGQLPALFGFSVSADTLFGDARGFVDGIRRRSRRSDGRGDRSGVGVVDPRLAARSEQDPRCARRGGRLDAARRGVRLARRAPGGRVAAQRTAGAGTRGAVVG